MFLNIQNKQPRKIVEASIISNCKTQFFQLVFLFCQISAKQLQNTLFKLELIIRIHTHPLMFFNKTSNLNFPKLQTIKFLTFLIEFLKIL